MLLLTCSSSAQKTHLRPQRRCVESHRAQACIGVFARIQGLQTSVVPRSGESITASTPPRVEPWLRLTLVFLSRSISTHPKILGPSKSNF